MRARVCLRTAAESRRLMRAVDLLERRVHGSGKNSPGALDVLCLPSIEQARARIEQVDALLQATGRRRGSYAPQPDSIEISDDTRWWVDKTLSARIADALNRPEDLNAALHVVEVLRVRRGKRGLHGITHHWAYVSRALSNPTDRAYFRTLYPPPTEPPDPHPTQRRVRDLLADTAAGLSPPT